MPKVILARCVKSELDGIWGFIAERNPAAADRFLHATHDAFRLLAGRPEMGSRREFDASRISNLRMFPISGFEKYLIFYQPTDHGIEVFHVFHTARDLERLWEN